MRGVRARVSGRAGPTPHRSRGGAVARGRSAASRRWAAGPSRAVSRRPVATTRGVTGRRVREARVTASKASWSRRVQGSPYSSRTRGCTVPTTTSRAAQLNGCRSVGSSTSSSVIPARSRPTRQVRLVGVQPAVELLPEAGVGRRDRRAGHAVHLAEGQPVLPPGLELVPVQGTDERLVDRTGGVREERHRHVGQPRVEGRVGRPGRVLRGDVLPDRARHLLVHRLHAGELDVGLGRASRARSSRTRWPCAACGRRASRRRRRCAASCPRTPAPRAPRPATRAGRSTARRPAPPSCGAPATSTAGSTRPRHPRGTPLAAGSVRR